MSARRPRVGVSACFFHADPSRPVFKGRTLLYVEESLAHWIMAGGAVPFMVPTPSGRIDLDAVVDELDGLVLHGGADVSPRSYGEEPLRPEWNGDFVRDQYELALLRACMKQDKPVLGVCRGLQLINVALGGTLYQDITTQKQGALVHRDWDVYERNAHELRIVEGTRLHEVAGRERARINSVHHQGIKDLAPGLEVEARAEPDGVIEAVRLVGPRDSDSEIPAGAYVSAVQWHPEFQTDADTELLPRHLVLEDFLGAVEARLQHAPRRRR